MEVQELLKGLGFNESQIKSLTKEDITESEIKKLADAHNDSVRSTIEDEYETKLKDEKESLKKQVYAEVSKKVKKEISNELGLKIDGIDDLNIKDFATKIPKVDVSNETEDKRRITELEIALKGFDELKEKEKRELQETHLKEISSIKGNLTDKELRNQLLKRASDLKNKVIESNDFIADTIALKLKGRVAKIELNDKNEFEFFDSEGKVIKNDLKMPMSLDDIIKDDLSNFISNAPAKPDGIKTGADGKDIKYSDAALKLIADYANA